MDSGVRRSTCESQRLHGCGTSSTLPNLSVPWCPPLCGEMPAFPLLAVRAIQARTGARAQEACGVAVTGMEVSPLVF